MLARVISVLIQNGRDQITIFEMDAIQLILDILEWNKWQYEAKDGKFYWYPDYSYSI